MAAFIHSQVLPYHFPMPHQQNEGGRLGAYCSSKEFVLYKARVNIHCAITAAVLIPQPVSSDGCLISRRWAH